MTPEGKVKADIKRMLSKLEMEGYSIYKFMPVPYGYGPSSLDFILCVTGRFIAIETKAPFKKPTGRQNAIARAMEKAKGKVFIVDGTSETDTIEHVENYLRNLLEEGEEK